MEFLRLNVYTQFLCVTFRYFTNKGFMRLICQVFKQAFCAWRTLRHYSHISVTRRLACLPFADCQWLAVNPLPNCLLFFQSYMPFRDSTRLNLFINKLPFVISFYRNKVAFFTLAVVSVLGPCFSWLGKCVAGIFKAYVIVFYKTKIVEVQENVSNLSVLKLRKK